MGHFIFHMMTFLTCIVAKCITNSINLYCVCIVLHCCIVLCCVALRCVVYCIQGSYGSWKTWKVLEFYYGIFQDWKSPGKMPLVLESSGNLLNSTKKYEVYGR